jgi:shikimate dehydrogenase
MKSYGLIGFPLSHSFSEKYFAEKFMREGIVNCSYINYPMADIGAIRHWIRTQPELEGINVTIPYKEKIVDFLDALDPEAAGIGAVNTIKVMRDQGKITLKGFNTDAYGFRTSLIPLLKPFHKGALVLGTGGASRAVVYVLNNLGIETTCVSRRGPGEKRLSYDQLTEQIMTRSTIIVNTSPVGMYPHVSDFPAIPYEFITPEHLLYDLIYNPSETRFLSIGESKGAAIKNGLQMLHLQAERSWEIWNTEP